MWEKLMHDLRPSELEQIRGILVAAYNDRMAELPDSIDQSEIVPAALFHEAIVTIDSSM